MIQNLTKENFFNALRELYLEAVDQFRKWIDEYKAEVKWQDLFAPGVKFNDLPLELQIGILARFDFHILEEAGERYEEMATGVPDEVKDLFERVQKKLKP